MANFIFNCRAATLLLEMRQAQTLTSAERLQLGVHLLLCSYCRRYDQQSRRISRAARQSVDDSTPAYLPEARKAQMQELLNQ